MEKLVRFYNQNKKAIFKYLGIIIVGYSLLQIMNLYYKNKGDEEHNNIKNIVVSEKSIENTNVSNSITKNKTIIENFIDYCENNNVEEAYNMLSNETKEKNKYSSVEKFKDNFIINFLKTGSDYTLNKMDNYSNVYVIEVYNGDLLSTGNINSIGKKYLKEDNNKIDLLDFI